eukprot:TRINITY_DN4162_c0_g2_i1.p1 TRINITY_DN4162_c0_g2~~TRINITY_DN4162_c0_g2_i1.p1  ORF type:complete len:196 (-),score=60.69 TRINITY_DN4162_c0_g2_i1:54-563(-)
MAAYSQGSACRRSNMSRYFSENIGSKICNGYCDNCQNSFEFDQRDVHDVACSFVGILHNAAIAKTNITMKALVDTARGVGKFKKFNHEGPVDKKKWSKDSLEWVVIHLIKERYLSMKFVTSAYMTNSYVIAGHKAGQVRSIGNCQRSFKRPILMNFRKAKTKRTKKRKK